MTTTTPSVTPTTPVNSIWLLPGTRVGAYVIRRALSRGGGQIAYLAEGPRRRTVVLKMSLFPKGERDSDSRMMHRRFLRQVAFFLELDGVPGVAKVSAYGMHPDTSRDGHLYMVQEWVPKSRTIVDWCREEPRPLNIIVCGWVMLAAACGDMARRGICHRDLKADNVLMTPRGVPKIIDFNSGIGPGAERLTWPSSRCVPGTPSSYSPEHCEAILEEYATRLPVPFQYFPTGDLHALGVIFYEVLTGQHPFSGPKGEALYERIAHQMPERPRLLNPEVPFGLEKVTMKLLQKKPELRYQSGDQLALELEALFATGEDWSRPFRTPPKGHHVESSVTTRQPPAAETWADQPVVIGAIVPAAPSAIVRAGPMAIVLKGPFALAPGPTPVSEAPNRPKRWRAVAFGLMAMASLFLGWGALRADDAVMPLLGLLLICGAAYVAAVYALRARPLGRLLAVLGASGAGLCVGLDAIWLRHDRRGWSASPSGYGGELASFIGGMVFLVLPLSLLGAGLGTWAGLRLTRERSRWVQVAAGAAAIAVASIAAVTSL